jgi:hypothetical protein
MMQTFNPNGGSREYIMYQFTLHGLLFTFLSTANLAAGKCIIEDNCIRNCIYSYENIEYQYAVLETHIS